jgi:hypothetical protein
MIETLTILASGVIAHKCSEGRIPLFEHGLDNRFLTIYFSQLGLLTRKVAKQFIQMT